MSPHPYTEDQLVEQPAIALLAELGWTTVNALDEVLGLDGTFGRETKSDVVLCRTSQGGAGPPQSRRTRRGHHRGD